MGKGLIWAGVIMLVTGVLLLIIGLIGLGASGGTTRTGDTTTDSAGHIILPPVHHTWQHVLIWIGLALILVGVIVLAFGANRYRKEKAALVATEEGVMMMEDEGDGGDFDGYHYSAQPHHGQGQQGQGHQGQGHQSQGYGQGQQGQGYGQGQQGQGYGPGFPPPLTGTHNRTITVREEL